MWHFGELAPNVTLSSESECNLAGVYANYNSDSSIGPNIGSLVQKSLTTLFIYIRAAIGIRITQWPLGQADSQQRSYNIANPKWTHQLQPR